MLAVDEEGSSAPVKVMRRGSQEVVSTRGLVAMHDQEHIGAGACSPHVACFDGKAVLDPHRALTPVNVPADGPAMTCKACVI